MNKTDWPRMLTYQWFIVDGGEICVSDICNLWNSCVPSKHYTFHLDPHIPTRPHHPTLCLKICNLQYHRFRKTVMLSNIWIECKQIKRKLQICRLWKSMLIIELKEKNLLEQQFQYPTWIFFSLQRIQMTKCEKWEKIRANLSIC